MEPTTAQEKMGPKCHKISFYCVLLIFLGNLGPPPRGSGLMRTTISGEDLISYRSVSCPMIYNEMKAVANKKSL